MYYVCFLGYNSPFGWIFKLVDFRFNFFLFFFSDLLKLCSLFGFKVSNFNDIFDDYSKLWQIRNNIHVILIFASSRKAEPQNSRCVRSFSHSTLFSSETTINMTDLDFGWKFKCSFEKRISPPNIIIILLLQCIKWILWSIENIHINCEWGDSLSCDSKRSHESFLVWVLKEKGAYFYFEA